MELSDLYAFTVKADGDLLHTVRTGSLYPKNWIAPRLVLAAERVGGFYRLLYLCGTNPYQMDRPRREYPEEVREVFKSYNPGNLRLTNQFDVAAEMLYFGMIDIVRLDKYGKIVETIKE